MDREGGRKKGEVERREREVEERGDGRGENTSSQRYRRSDERWNWT